MDKNKREHIKKIVGASIAAAAFAMATPADAKKIKIPQSSLEDAWQGEIIMDNKTGKVLYGRNVDTPMFGASTVKVATLTALAQAERDGLVSKKDTVTVRKGRKNHTLDLMDAKLAVSVLSDNEAARALQGLLESRSGKSFHNLTKSIIQSAGLQNTNIVEASGLSNSAEDLKWKGQRFSMAKVVEKVGSVLKHHWDKNTDAPPPFNYTTPRDLAKLTHYAVSTYPELIPILAATSFDGYGRNEHKHNPFLVSSAKDGIVGKTGYTKLAGGCITFVDPKTDTTITLLHGQTPPGEMKTWLSARAEALLGQAVSLAHAAPSLENN